MLVYIWKGNLIDSTLHRSTHQNLHDTQLHDTAAIDSAFHLTLNWWSVQKIIHLTMCQFGQINSITWPNLFLVASRNNFVKCLDIDSRQFRTYSFVPLNDTIFQFFCFFIRDLIVLIQVNRSKPFYQWNTSNGTAYHTL